ncbi:phage tail protein [uncultured Mitsuokella sp.]|uniref:TipJ family phage tail tip protein n=1 Tax=uncultured Mitsuokella sp. TaxID=453120 RepID=UPI00259AA957|nr:phage tail protein [uncultured Mitsuokella sp.]
MIQIVKVANPFEPTRHEIEEICYTGGKVTAYVETEGRDVYIDGNLVENPDETTPLDGSQIVVIPHIAGKGIMRVLGLVAMIALSVYSSNIAGGLWKGLGTAFRAGHIGALLASGAVMFLGGKIINAVFPQAVDNINWNDHETTQTYGWDLPTPTTTAGTVVGETYGECIPAPQLLEQHVETVNDEQYLNLLYCGGYGPVDSIDNIRIDYTDIGNFSGVQLETRLGTNDQKPISFFKNTPLDQSVGVELVQGQVVARTSDSTKASALDVTLEFPAGLYHVNDKGDYDNATATFLLEYRKGQSDSWHNFKKGDTGYHYSVTAATNSALRRTFSVAGLEAGQYDVRVTAVNKPTSSRYQSMVNWSIMTSYIDGIYSRPNKVLVALRIKANNQLSGGVPSLNWRQTRKTVLVHNPKTGYYEQRAADNPIWACYDILHGCRSLKNIKTGENEYVVSGYPASCLDAYWQQWKSAAAYADEEITNQDGEKEPRYRFDAFFDTAQKRWTAAQKAANVGHAVIIPHGRNIGIVVDRPGHITQIFGEGRTTVSSVKGSFSSTEDRARAIEVTYNDGQNDFKNTVMTVRSPNYNTDRSSDNTAQLTLFGVKRRSQAYREAITALATNERQLQFIELSADIDAIVAEYGDIVGFNHAVSRLGIASGRIVSATATAVKLDKTVQLDAAKKYEIYISLSNDNLIHRDVVAETTETDTLKLTTPFESAALPQRFDNYAFGEVDKAVKPFRIVNAERDGDLKVSLKLAEYDEAMYSDELDYSKYPVIDYSNTPSVAQITTLTASEESYTADKTSVSNVRVTWQLARQGIAPDSYIVRIKSRTSDYDEQVSTRMTTHVFHGVRQGDDYDITVYSIFDALTADSKTTSLHVHGTTYTVNNASNLVVMLVGKGFNLSWRGATGTAVAGYNVYRGKYGMTIEQCERVSTRQTATACYVATQDAGQYVFYVESVDKDGNTFGETLTGIGSIAMPGKVTDASAYTIYRQYQDGATGYDIVVSFGLPTTATVADVAVYYKTNHIDMSKLSGPLPEGVPADELGYHADWRYAGKGTSRVTIPAAQLGDTYRIKLVAEDVNGFTTPDEDATYIELTVEAKQTVPDTPTGFHKAFALGKGFTFAWSDVTNSDVDYYELRYDQNPGAAYNLLARAQGTSITLESMPARKATIYLYAHNATKKYSYPTSLSYDYPVLAAPGGLTIEKAILAANISVPDIPTGADGVRLYIEHQPIDIGKNTHYTYSNQAGIYTVTACYYDIFGEGYQTAEYQTVIDPYIDPKYIEDESISLKKVDGTIKTAVSDAQQAIPRIDAIDGNIETINENITDLQKADGEIVATVTANKKASDEADASLASQLKQTAESITSTVQSNKKEQDKKNQSLDVDISQLKQTAESITSTVQSDKKELSSQIAQNADKITSVVTNLNDKNKASVAYSAIAQMIDAIQLRVTADDLKEMGQSGQLMSYINLTPTTVSILSKLLHITADTLIDGNVITNGMIKAGAITADKLAASIIELTANQGIKGGGATLDTNGLTVRGSDGSYVVHGSNGMEFHDGNGNKFAMVGAMVMGTVKDGQWVKFTKPWKTVPNVIVTPISLQTGIAEYTSTNLYLDCRPQNVTVNGFQAVCRTVLKAGSGGLVPVNKTVTGHTSYETITINGTEITIPEKATTFTINVTWSITNYGEDETHHEDDFHAYLGPAYLNLKIDVNGTNKVDKRIGTAPADDWYYEKTFSGGDSKTIAVSGGDKIKIYFVVTTGHGNWRGFNEADISATIGNYSFNTTADVALASGNAFFLCTDKHNSPYTVSDSQ